MNYLLFKIHP